MIRKRNNKRLYESIMRDVAKTIKRHLNENEYEYYVWYANHEDGQTHDMSYDGILSYQFGWKVGGPFSLNQAKQFLLKTVDKELLGYWYEVKNYWFNDYKPTDQDKIDFIKNRGNYEVRNNGMNIIFSDLHDNFNTMEWLILTKDEIDQREKEYYSEDNKYSFKKENDEPRNYSSKDIKIIEEVKNLQKYMDSLYKNNKSMLLNKFNLNDSACGIEFNGDDRFFEEDSFPDACLDYQDRIYENIEDDYDFDFDIDLGINWGYLSYWEDVEVNPVFPYIVKDFIEKL